MEATQIAGPGAANDTEALAVRMPSRFQFAPRAGWMNDPNGLVFFDGAYHLFFQHHPTSKQWGPMHWGHAVSRDLVSWVELPIALSPDERGYIFSGSVVVDSDNRSGLARGGEPVLIAFFTHHDYDGKIAGRADYESQSIALSHDGGWSWEKFPHNPVLANPGDLADFRDPCVFWHEDTKAWIMVLAAGDRAKIYRSTSLTSWTWASDFVLEPSDAPRLWECPNLCQAHTDDGESTRWVLIQSFHPGGRYGSSGTQYFVGDFDGYAFQLDPAFDKHRQEKGPQWFDWGPDNYAAISWANLPSPQPTLVGWMNNWAYALETLETPGRGRMTMPRTISLVWQDGAPLLRARVALPDTVFERPNRGGVDLSDDAVAVFEVIATHPNQIAKIALASGDAVVVTIAYDPARSAFVVDRSASHPTGRRDGTAACFEFSRLRASAPTKIRLYVSRHAIEAFFDDGLQTATMLLNPTLPVGGVQLDGFAYC